MREGAYEFLGYGCNYELTSAREPCVKKGVVTLIWQEQH
jgi:hypothetical protein